MSASSSLSSVSSSSSLASVSPTSSVIHCASPGCSNVASLKCPTCVQLNLTPTLFCSQECFKSNWKTHNIVHKIEKSRLEFVPPAFHYTGTLRPAYVTPARSVPDSIEKPEYALSGQPVSEMSRAAATIPVYSKEEIEGVRKACKIGREALDLAHRMIRPGITTDSIDVAVHDYIVSQGAYPSPLNYYNFPKSICTSVNESVCHGIPDLRKLEEGDIINVDVSVYYKGYHGDLNETYPVGKVDEDSKTLIKATYDSLDQCMQYAKPGVLVREFGDIITKHVTKFGFGVVRTYCGHGIGRLFHCPPNVPHYAKNKAIGTLKPGMIFTIEPMINAGTYRDVTWPDEWTSTTADGRRSAQFEHTLLVTETGVEILTARTSQSPKLFWELDGASPSSTPSSDPSSDPSFSSSQSANSSESKEKESADSMEEDEPEESSDAKKKKKKKKKKTNANTTAGTDSATTSL